MKLFKIKVKSLFKSLLMHRAITTTLTKAKSLVRHGSKDITRFLKYEKSKDLMNYHRYVASLGLNYKIIHELMKEILESNRTSGYLQIIKCGHRKGDGAIKAIVKFVGVNIYEREKAPQDGIEKKVKSKKVNQFEKFRREKRKNEKAQVRKSRQHRTQSR